MTKSIIVLAIVAGALSFASAADASDELTGVYAGPLISMDSAHVNGTSLKRGVGYGGQLMGLMRLPDDLFFGAKSDLTAGGFHAPDVHERVSGSLSVMFGYVLDDSILIHADAGYRYGSVDAKNLSDDPTYSGLPLGAGVAFDIGDRWLIGLDYDVTHARLHSETKGVNNLHATEQRWTTSLMVRF